MLLNAVLLIQDIQVLCYAIVFGVLALQKWSDKTRRWFWFGFLANVAGAVLDMTAAHLPYWLSRGVNGVMIPLSYAFLNVSLVYFQKHGKRLVFASFLFLLAGLAVSVAWSYDPVRIHSDALGDLMVALECAVTTILLFGGGEKATRAPRFLMGGFLAVFVVVELARVIVAFPMHGDPDVTTPKLVIVSLVAYVTDVALVPLAYIWMMQARMEWNLYQQSIADPLTGVLNRRGLENALELELSRSRRYGHELTLVILDLDHFKGINDRFGHFAGDTILIGVARFLGAQLRKNDVVGRFGGEEFILVLPHADRDDAGPLIERLCNSLAEYRGLLPPASLAVTASFGVSGTHGRSTVTNAELLAEADHALYGAKANGRNQVCYSHIYKGLPEIEEPSADFKAGEPKASACETCLPNPSEAHAPDRPMQPAALGKVLPELRR